MKMELAGDNISYAYGTQFEVNEPGKIFINVYSDTTADLKIYGVKNRS